MSVETWRLIKAAFVASHKTIKAVAKEAGVDERTLRKIINQGYRNVRWDTEAALLDYFGIVMVPVPKEYVIIIPPHLEDYMFLLEDLGINEMNNHARLKSYLNRIQDNKKDTEDFENYN